MTQRFHPGQRVRALTVDPPNHTRLPRYARGAVGEIVECEGAHPRPDERSRGLPSDPQPVYAVRFAARELFGAGDHTVTLALWESYLTDAEEAR